jgi:4-amino-4-deoxy-L-arabinose transferase-like glycosyltransferase
MTDRDGAGGVLRLLASRAFPWVVLPALWALVYLPNLGARPLRLEEGRRAIPARAMLDTGNFVVPTLYGEPYPSKPPGFFWMVAAVGAMGGGVGEVAVRLPSVVSVLLGAWLVVLFARRELPPLTRHLAALLFVSGFIMLDKGTLGEIDAVFTLLVFGTLAAWWGGYRPEGHTLRSWLAVGALLGAAILTKGPVALVLFYAPVIVFLVWEGRARRLLAPGHALALALGVVPTLLWAGRLLRHVPLSVAGAHWSRELLGDVANKVPSLDYVRQLLLFPIDVFVMTLPWVLAAVPLLLPRAAGRPEMPEPLRRFLVSVVVAPVAFFWIFPHSRARYVLVIWYVVSILAAVWLAERTSAADQPWLERASRLALRGSVVALPMVGGLGVVAALFLYPPALATTVLALLACLAAAAVTASMAHTESPRFRRPAIAVAGAVLILAVGMEAALIFRPWKAESDSPRLVWRAVHPYIPEGLPLYTRVQYHNQLFYFGPRVRALADGQYEQLPADQPAIVLTTREEIDRIRARADLDWRLLAEAPAGAFRDGRTLAVLEVTRRTGRGSPARRRRPPPPE